MAYSTQRATSDGTLAYMDLSIGYIKRADISVYYDGLPADPATWAWAGTTDKRINFTPNVPNGVEVLLVRKTQINGIIHVFSLGAKFNNSTMDQDFTQLLYLNQEAVEGAALTDIFTNVDFHGNRITNLGDAVDDLDAVNKRTVLSLTSDSVDAAAASAAAAASSAGSAATSATSSLNYSNLARDWAIKMDGLVDGVDYSSKYWAGQAAIVVTNNVPRTSATGSAVTPAGTTGQRDGSPLPGYFRYNTTDLRFEGYSNGAWGEIGGGATGGGTNKAFYLADTHITDNYTIPTGKNAFTPGPVEIDATKEVVVPPGSTWTIG